MTASLFYTQCILIEFPQLFSHSSSWHFQSHSLLYFMVSITLPDDDGRFFSAYQILFKIVIIIETNKNI